MIPRIFHEPVELYLARLAVSQPMPSIFEVLHAEANRRLFPIVGPEVGRLFAQLAMLRRPRRILELGSGFGYSALWFAHGFPEAEIHLTDSRQSNLDAAAEHARNAGFATNFHYHHGDALRSARKLDGPWDIIFCDIDKEEYPAGLDFANEAATAGTVLLFDNMLWYGCVADAEDEQDAPTRAAVETTRRLYADPRWLCSLLPIRDGVVMAVRKDEGGSMKDE